MLRFQLRNASISRYERDDSVLVLAEGRLRAAATAVRVSAGRSAADCEIRLRLMFQPDFGSDRSETRVAREPRYELCA